MVYSCDISVMLVSFVSMSSFTIYNTLVNNKLMHVGVRPILFWERLNFKPNQTYLKLRASFTTTTTITTTTTATKKTVTLTNTIATQIRLSDYASY